MRIDKSGEVKHLEKVAEFKSGIVQPIEKIAPLKARFKHDCSVCVYLGEFQDYDLYYCPDEPTVIARYGTGGDYLSGLYFITTFPLLEAYNRASKAGLISDEVKITTHDYLLKGLYNGH